MKLTWQHVYASIYLNTLFQVGISYKYEKSQFSMLVGILMQVVVAVVL